MQKWTHPLASLYQDRALDPLIDIACVVALDFVNRPQHYKRVPDDVADILGHLRSSLGHHPDWPSVSQRNTVLRRLLNRFSAEFAKIRLTAIRYQKGETGPSEIALVAFKEDAALLRGKVQPLEGSGLSAVERVNSALLANALTVLKSEAVLDAFGVAKEPKVTTGQKENWFDDDLFSPQLAYLCECVTQTFRLDRPIHQPKLSLLQRAAYYGSKTLDSVLNSSMVDGDGERIISTMQSAAAWASALGDLVLSINVVRAWSDPAYRRGLSVLEKDIMPPHPSGDIDLEGTIKTESPGFPGAWVAADVVGLRPPVTFTVGGEICCSTGDIGCDGPTSTNGQCDISDDCPTLTGILT